MRNLLLTLCYDGAQYHGWQIQNNAVSVQQVFQEALFKVTSEQPEIKGCSRTDSGVHARGNVAVFDTENRMPADKICFALNQRLPEDIRIQSSMEVEPDWHPRKHHCIKTYEYKILNRKMEVPSLRLYTHFCHFDLDLDQMRQAAKLLTGEHDYKSFCNVRTQVLDTVRTVYSIDIEKDSNDVITIRVRGNGFLYNMVRILAGTLMAVGMGQRKPEEMPDILAACDRAAAGPTAPAKGLMLVGMEYQD